MDAAAPSGPPVREQGSAAPSPSSGAIDWQRSEQDARARARKLHVPMVVFVRADWSIASVEADRTLWRDPRVVAELRRFIALRLDVTRGEIDDEASVERYGVHAIPSVVLVDESGKTSSVVDPPLDVERVLGALRQLE